jgi:hypothetical protein
MFVGSVHSPELAFRTLMPGSGSSAQGINHDLGPGTIDNAALCWYIRVFAMRNNRALPC